MSSLLHTLRASFSPLRQPNFRIYLSGQAVSLLGSWMQITAQGWVVWELSHSATALSLVTTLGTLPILFVAPFSGVLADRVDRRKLLIFSQTAMMLLAFVLALLVQTHAVRLWHIYTLALLLGVANSVDFPAQQAFLGDLSGLGEVRHAVVLNALVLQVSRMLGPALAGFVVSWLGSALAFWVNGASFLAVIASLLAVHSHANIPAGKAHPLVEFWDGLRFIATQPRMQDLLLSTSLVTFFGIAIMAILPALAGQVLQGQADTLGLLMSASGAGALISALLFVPLAQSLRRTGLVIGLASLWAGFGYIFLSTSRQLPLSMAFIFMTGLSVPVILTTSNGLIQVMAPPGMRARLLAAFNIVGFGIQPLAALVIGFSAQHLGVPRAIQINGALMCIGAFALLVLRPAWRHWEAARHLAATGAS